MGSPTTPCDRSSALFVKEGMYVGSSKRFDVARSEDEQQRVSFHAGFLDCPFQKEAITDVLSQLTLKQAS